MVVIGIALPYLIINAINSLKRKGLVTWVAYTISNRTIRIVRRPIRPIHSRANKVERSITECNDP